MKNCRSIIAIFSFGLFAFGAMSVLPVASAMAANANEQKVSAKVGKPLEEALTAGKARQWDQALMRVREADAVSEKTPYDQFKINDIFAWVYTSQKKYAEAAPIYEKLIDSPFVSPTDADLYTKNVAQMYMVLNNNTKAIEYLQRWLKAHPGDADMTAILGQLQFKAGQLKQSLDTFSGLVSATEKAGQKPKEDWLKIMYRESYQLSGNTNTLDKPTLAIVEKLLRYYPNESYWQSMLAGLKQEQTTDSGRFQLDRLMLAVGTLKDPNDFIEMAQLANNFGFPGEALSVLDAGYAKGILGTSASKDREDRLKASIQKLADADKAALPALDKKARASATGQDDASLGEAYYGYGRYPEAIEALERGIKKGGLKKPEQAQLALGIAYLRAGQPDKARAAFKQIPKSSEFGRLADLWILHSASVK